MYPHQTPTKNPKPTSKVATAIRVSTIGNADRFPRNSAFPGPTQTRPPAQTFPREQTAQYKSCRDSRAPMDRTSNRAQSKLPPIDFVHHCQMLSRFHQKCGPRVAGKPGRILGMLPILNIRDRPHFFSRGVANDKAAALEWKLALSVRNHRIHVRAVYRRILHCCSSHFEVSGRRIRKQRRHLSAHRRSL